MAQRDFLTGALLIAMPNMTDPRFERTVSFICAHDEDHAMAIVVNKPLKDLEVGDLLEQLEIDPRPAIAGEPVHFGGPVQTDRGLVLHTLDYRLETTLPASDEIGLTASRTILEDIAGARPEREPPERFCFAIGYAGWGAGQLEQEIAANAWAHCPADLDLVFPDNAEESWSRALAKLGVTGAMLSPEWSQSRPPGGALN